MFVAAVGERRRHPSGNADVILYLINELHFPVTEEVFSILLIRKIKKKKKIKKKEEESVVAGNRGDTLLAMLTSSSTSSTNYTFLLRTRYLVSV